MIRSIVLGLSVALALTACEPRGESRSLEEILAFAEERLVEAKRTEVPTEVASMLSDLEQQLRTFLKGDGELPTVAGNISAMLQRLTGAAGYTARPALRELAAQFTTIASSEQAPPEFARMLLVARSFSLIASELSTTRFVVEPLANR